MYWIAVSLLVYWVADYPRAMLLALAFLFFWRQGRKRAVRFK